MDVGSTSARLQQVRLKKYEDLLLVMVTGFLCCLSEWAKERSSHSIFSPKTSNITIDNHSVFAIVITGYSDMDSTIILSYACDN